MLAASEIEPSEIYQFFRVIEMRGANRATNFVLALRDHARDFRSIGLPKKSSANLHKAARPTSDLSENIRRQLKTLNLSSHQLFESVQKELRGIGVNPRDLPPFNKISLSVWLDRAARRIGSEKLMQAVKAVLARHSSNLPIDWPLKRDSQ